MRQIVISKNDSGQRLDRFLQKAFPLFSTGLIYKYIRLKRIKLNGARAEVAAKLTEGDVLLLYVNDELLEVPSRDKAFLRINARPEVVYEDENILILNKPAGLSVHEDESGNPDTLLSRLQAYLFEKGEWNPEDSMSFAPALANRIDRNTVGLVLAAKNAAALRILTEKIRLREIKKYYLCAVHGNVSKKQGTLTNYLYKDDISKQVFVHADRSRGAKTAQTNYRVLQSTGELSLLECELITGRTHQIRVQLSYAGHPLLGDGKYGREEKIYKEKRQALCSYRLRFEFLENAEVLEYLRGREYKITDIWFVKKYFPEYSV